MQLIDFLIEKEQEKNSLQSSRCNVFNLNFNYWNKIVEYDCT